jgi:transcription initiation factor TFIIH subunit 4
MEKTDVLHFLLMLGSLELGQAYSVNTLTQTQNMMLTDLRDYGVVYQRKVVMSSILATLRFLTMTGVV